MKILVTGSSGFIGQNLLPALKSKYKTFALESDLLDFVKVQNEVQLINPDVILHLAAKTEVEKSFYEQTDFSNVNYVGTVNLIESAAKLNKKPFFLFSSTMEVFGWQSISDEVKKISIPQNFLAFDENTRPNPNAPYAVAKYACEKYLEYAKRAYNLNFVGLRQTNTFGRENNNFFVTENIISQMLNSYEINLGYSEPYRNFIYIDDLVDAWLTVIKNKEKLSGLFLTVGPNNPIKIKDYCNLIAKKLDWNGLVNWNTRPERSGEIFWLNSNYTLLQKITGWEPKLTLEEGLEKTIKKLNKT